MSYEYQLIAAPRMQAAGFYHNLDLKPSLPYRNFNTWMGDPTRALQAREILNIIKRDCLLDNTSLVGDYIYRNLHAIATGTEGAGKILNLRGEGQGTFIAWDAPSPAKRDEFITRMRAQGIHMGGCGDQVSSQALPLISIQKFSSDGATSSNACLPTAPR